LTAPRITDVRYARASEADRASGLLGYIAVTVGGGLRLDGLALRRSRRGTLYIAYPARGPGKLHPYVEPTSDHARRELERAVLEALGVDPEVAR
jgi:DNA-binding cell septation regulator SpoVG